MWRKIPSTSNQNAIKEKRAVEKMQEVSGGSTGMGPQELANVMNSQGHRYLNVALVPYNSATYLAMQSFEADPVWIVIGFLASFIPAVCHYTWIPAKENCILFNKFFVLRTWDPIPTIWHLHASTWWSNRTSWLPHHLPHLFYQAHLPLDEHLGGGISRATSAQMPLNPTKPPWNRIEKQAKNNYLHQNSKNASKVPIKCQ